MSLDKIKEKLKEPWRTWTWSEVQWLYERCYDELAKREGQPKPAQEWTDGFLISLGIDGSKQRKLLCAAHNAALAAIERDRDEWRESAAGYGTDAEVAKNDLVETTADLEDAMSRVEKLREQLAAERKRADEAEQGELNEARKLAAVQKPWTELPRHDDLENPPDYSTLRDDYWRLFEKLVADRGKRIEAERDSKADSDENDRLRAQVAVAVDALEQIAATCVGDKPTLEEQIAQRALAAISKDK